MKRKKLTGFLKKCIHVGDLRLIDKLDLVTGKPHPYLLRIKCDDCGEISTTHMVKLVRIGE